MKKIKVLIIDDSAMVRKIFSRELAADPAIEVVGTAPDPFIGRDKIVFLKPDVLLLDIEMPKMDGITFLNKLMKHYPIPVIIISSLAKDGGEVALKAIEAGAAEVIAKPGSSFSVNDMTGQLIEKIKSVAAIKDINNYIKLKSQVLGTAKKPIKSTVLKTTDKIIAIGASTGGTQAIKEILCRLPADMPPILVVQHMPQYFTKSFASRLNELCALEVTEALNGDYATPGKALIAQGNKHMELERSGARYYVKIYDGPMVFHQRPSVEVLFKSVAKNAGPNSIGVMLTGMGKDGAEGLLDMRNNQAYTISQDEKSSVVFGMPKEAINIGAVCQVLPLNKIAGRLIELVH